MRLEHVKHIKLEHKVLEVYLWKAGVTSYIQRYVHHMQLS